MHTRTLLEVNHLRYSYDGLLRVLDNVSFALPAGSIVGLIGPNGSGKSTLIKIIFDLLRLQLGSITIDGHPHSSAAARRSGIHLASSDRLPQFLTGREYIRTLASLYEVAVDEQEARALFALFAMAGRYDDLIEDYSHPMRKRAQLIAALLMRRPLTVIDETRNGIGLESLHIGEAELRRIRDDGRTLLLCTHDFALLERLADRILFLDLGELIEDAATGDLLGECGSLAGVVFSYLDAEGRGA